MSDTSKHEQDTHAHTPNALCIGVDTGGTFTDLVMLDGSQRIVATHKLLSTPDDPADAVLHGIEVLLRMIGVTDRCVEPPEVIHGSTVATNALIEGKTGNTAFVTTAGFEDTLHIARQDRPYLYALTPRRTDPPVSREHCIGATERMDPQGRVVEPLTDAGADTIVEQLRSIGVDAVAISLLHSYTNPSHERAIAETILAAFGDNVHITVSHELLPEYREYERGATCVVNAAVAPKMAGYIDRLTDALGEDRLSIMGSHGGTLSPRAAIAEPIRTILSGPAGGVLGAALDSDRLITFDMGGTSTDVALIHDGPTMTTQGRAAGLPVRLPMVDIHTIGAGGGSIAWLDDGGALRVGPRSAGATPGPACYGRQRDMIERGEWTTWQPTVTDAHIVLGRIPADTTLGDNVRLDAQASRAAVQVIADRVGLSLDDVAAGILRIVEANMIRAIHRVTLQAGRDPRDYTLMPFGGAGGLHACALAEQLGIRSVRVPPNPGLLSAIGMLSAPAKRTASRSLHHRIEPDDNAPDLADVFDALAAQAGAEMRRDGVRVRRYLFSIDLRYAGQSHELTIDANPRSTWQGGLYLDRFHQEHARLYGYSASHEPIELVAVRCEAVSAKGKVHPPDDPRADPIALNIGPVVERSGIYLGDRVPGPRIITEYSATTYVPEGWVASITGANDLLLRREADDA